MNRGRHIQTEEIRRQTGRDIETGIDGDSERDRHRQRLRDIETGIEGDRGRHGHKYIHTYIINNLHNKTVNQIRLKNVLIKN